MTTALPDTLLHFIQTCIPTFQSAQVLLFLVNHSDRDFTPEEIVTAMRPVVVRLSSVKEYAALFARHHVVKEHAGRYRYSAPVDVERSVHELARAYNEQPVTLIRAVSHSSL
ncbi:MAG TPA: hypothetical protein VH436_04430 [Vicinamibacterales bacterium]